MGEKEKAHKTRHRQNIFFFSPCNQRALHYIYFKLISADLLRAVLNELPGCVSRVVLVLVLVCGRVVGGGGGGVFTSETHDLGPVPRKMTNREVRRLRAPTTIAANGQKRKIKTGRFPPHDRRTQTHKHARHTKPLGRPISLPHRCYK